VSRAAIRDNYGRGKQERDERWVRDRGQEREER
jgi:hypothetical protein